MLSGHSISDALCLRIVCASADQMKDDTNELAKKIAELIVSQRDSDDPNGLAESIANINARLDGIDRKLAATSAHEENRPLNTHPSQDKFDVIEAVADQIIEHYQNEKACTFEPNGKPCDHCLMCSSRGF